MLTVAGCGHLTKNDRWCDMNAALLGFSGSHLSELNLLLGKIRENQERIYSENFTNFLFKKCTLLSKKGQ